MADPETPTSGPKKPGKKEMSVEQRMLLAFILMGLVLFATQYLYPTAPEKQVKQAQPASPQQQAKAPAPPPADPAKTTPPAEQPVGTITADSEQTFTVETNVYKVVFSNRGAVIRSWLLKQYRDGNNKPLEVVNSLVQGKVEYPLSLVFKGTKPSTDVNQVLFAAKPTADGLGIDYDYANGKTIVRKSVRFGRDTYLSQITTEVIENGTQLPHLVSWRGGFGDPTVLNATSLQHSVYYDQANASLVLNEAKVAKDGPVSASGNYTFAGLQDTFFAAVFLPRTGQQLEIQTISDNVPLASDQNKQEAHVGAAVGGSGKNELALFVGPKDVDLLKKVDPKLEQLVDYGKWFGFIAKPLFMVLNWVNDRWTHNYGWAIVFVTVAINFILLPLKMSSMKSMKKMQSLAPHIAAINEKYKNISLKDPRKAEQNQEVMGLYKKHGVNPAGGCVPLLLQIPFFIAFYTVLSVAIELRGARWLWVTDLSQPETIPIRLLPLLMVGTQFWLQKMTPSASADPAQQKVMMFMPLMMGFMFYGVSSGLVLYWLTGNIVGLAQQWFFNRTTGEPPAIEVKPAVAPKKKR